MVARASERTLFPSLLRYWRGKRGLSQLDLSLSAEVSARHVSFLETGRAQPSEDMVLRLAGALDLGLRDKNTLLVAAGFEQLFDEPAPDALGGLVGAVIERMMKQQEPYPLTVLDAGYDVVATNAAASALLSRVVAEPQHLTAPINLFSLLFDPRLARPFVVDWELLARAMLARLHREMLLAPSDRRLPRLLDLALGFPDVPRNFHEPDLRQGGDVTMIVALRRGQETWRFLTTVTSFSAPRNVTLEELRIESYFPADDATDAACKAWAAG